MLCYIYYLAYWQAILAPSAERPLLLADWLASEAPELVRKR